MTHEETARQRKDQMSAANYFGKSGPALFMEGPKVRSPKALSDGTRGVTSLQKIWKQPREYEERTSKRFLWLRGGLEGRGTTKPHKEVKAV